MRPKWKVAIEPLFLILLIALLPLCAAGSRSDGSGYSPFEAERGDLSKPGYTTGNDVRREVKEPVRVPREKVEPVAKPRIDLPLSYANGEVVARDKTTVMGRVTGPEDTQVQVDGVKAEVRVGSHGGFFVAENVPLELGENTIAVTATTPEGQLAEQTFDVIYEPRPISRARSVQAQQSDAAAQASTNSGITVSVNSTEDAVDLDPGDGVCETAPDNGVCTLRAAVLETNALSGQDTIQVPAGTYALAIPGRYEDSAVTGDLDITDPAGLRIRGTGRDSTVIDARQIDRVIHASGPVVLEVRDIAITGGKAETGYEFRDGYRYVFEPGAGGGIYLSWERGDLGGSLDLLDSTVRNNMAEGDGSGILAEGETTISDSSLISNTSTSGSGGGLYVDYGNLTVGRSLVKDNSAAQDGGGIAHEGEGTVFALHDSTISDNTAGRSAGGVMEYSYVPGSVLEIVSSMVDGNTSRESGGGVETYAEHSLIDRSIIKGNSTNSINPEQSLGGGGIFIWGKYTKISRSNIEGNSAISRLGGGGIYMTTFHAKITIEDSRVNGNRAEGDFGGGIALFGDVAEVHGSIISNNVISAKDPADGSALGGGISLSARIESKVTNTTISGNVAKGGYGGGIYSDEILANLDNATLYNNGALSGGNIMSLYTLLLHDSLVANSADGQSCTVWGSYSSIRSRGHNLDSGNSCSFDQPTDLTNTDPLLGPLRDNGGTNETHALQIGSPAIDAGGDFCPTSDQRGVPRMHDGDGDGVSACDIGAYEKEGSSTPVPPAAGKFELRATAPESLGVEDGALSPNPFTVSATVLYDGFAPTENASVSLSSSPEGLVVEGGTTLSLGPMSPGEKQEVSWQVRASKREVRRVYDLELEVSSPGLATQTASRQVVVPPIHANQDPPPGEGDDQGQCVDPNACGDDPINFVTGNVYEYREDLYVPGRGVPVRFVRFYNSRDPYAGPLGTGWTHSYNVSLEENPDGSVEEMDPQGKRLVYERNPDGSYSPPAGFHDALTKNPDGTFTLIRKDGREKWSFDANGVLTGISDPNGNSLSFSRDAQGGLAVITDSAGRRILFEYDASGRISTLTDPMGNITRYAYDVAGDLVSVTDPIGDTVLYEYDAGHNLTRITDKTGGAFLFSYDDQDRAVSARADDGTWAATIAYEDANNKTTVTDSKGRESIFHYNEMSRITRLEQPDGTALDYAFDAAGNRTSRTNSNASTARAIYDENGNPIEVTMPDGATTRTAYDQDGNPTSVTDALDNTTRYVYDEHGNLISETDPLGNETTYIYDEHGQLLETKKPSGKKDPDGTLATATTIYAYNEQGDKISETDALGNETTYTYDAMGRMTSTTDARGNVIRYEHDALGRVTKVINPDGTTVLTRYDPAGNPVEITDEAGHTTKTSYDPRGNPTSVTDPVGNVTRYKYDTEGNLAAEIDALGNKTTYGYDALGRKTKEIHPDGTTDPDGTSGTVTTTYSYDAAGNMISNTDPLGRVTRMAYDAADRLVRVTDPGGGVATYEYDALGRRTRAVDPKGHATTYEYDALGRLTREMDPLLNSTIYTYDAAGNQKSRTDAAGRRTKYAYDAMNRLTATTYPNGTKVQSTYDSVGNRTSISDETGVYSYTYDPRNRPTGETWPGNRTVGYEYDAAGNRIALFHPDGGKVQYTYDAAGRISSVTDRGGAITTYYAYDALGRPTRVSHPNGTGSTYAYDPIGRVTRTATTGTNTAGGSTNLARLTYAYDDASNPISITDKSGQRSSFSYDVLDRLTKEAYPERTYTYTYDAAGNRKTMTRDTPTTNLVTTSYAYDAAGRMTRAGSTTYGYDKMGNMTSKTKGSTTTRYRYDYEGMMTRAGTKTYARDPLGRVVSSTFGAKTTAYLFDGQQIIEEKTGTSAPAYYARGLDQQLVSRRTGTGSPSYYHHDAIGSVTTLTNNSGAMTDTYAYTAFGSVRAKTGTSAQPFQYLGNTYDPATKLHDFHARMYDPSVGRFLSEDPVTGLPSLTQTMNPYSCSANNPLRYPDPSGRLGNGMVDDDPLVPSGGDSPHSARAQKLPDTGAREDACPGVNKFEDHWWGYQLYLDECTTRAVKNYLTAAGGSVAAASGLAALIAPESAPVTGPIFGIAIGLTTVGNGVIGLVDYYAHGIIIMGTQPPPPPPLPPFTMSPQVP